MNSSNGHQNQSHRAQHRPHYVPSSVVQATNKEVAHTPKPPVPSPARVHRNGSATASTPSVSTAGNAKALHGSSTPSDSRRPNVSPSAYDRFDEVSWIVNLSCRIGNALQTPPRASIRGSTVTPASPSSSSASVHARNRVRLPRPSKEFRDLQHKVQLSHGSTEPSEAPDTTADISASFEANDSAIKWAQHAQLDFERRRAELERSRRGILAHLAHDKEDLAADERAPEAQAEAPVDPAVQRSLLAAKSLQELMRTGGLMSEEGDDDPPGFADLLANAEPLPGAAELGPSSLFEANRSSDGTLDIESILQQRARMVAHHDHDQAGPSRAKTSMLDLSQSVPKPAKRPVIEVLEPQESGRESRQAARIDEGEDQAAHDATNEVQHASDESSSESSSESDDSSSAKDSDTQSNRATSTHSEEQGSSRVQQSAAPHPMDQISIVDGEFRIIPARRDQPFDQDTDEKGMEEEDSDEEDEDESEHDRDEDDRMESSSDAEASDDEDEMDDSAEHAYAAGEAQHSYHDGFGGMGTQNLLFDGPTGDADEPIVLSDSDDDDAQRNNEDEEHEDGDEEMDDEDEDELDDAFDQNESSEDDAQQPREQLPNPKAFLQEDARGQERDYLQKDAHAEGDMDISGERSIPVRSSASSSDNNAVPQSQFTPMSAAAQMVALASRDTSSSEPHAGFVSDERDDAMPESEVEAEEFDEELRWSDIEAGQPIDEETPMNQAPAITSADVAFRANNGTEPFPGFVTASQLFANIRAADTRSGDQDQDPARDADQAVGPIDPRLLAGLVDNQQTPYASAPLEAPAALAAAGARALQPERAPEQAEADIFDAFTRDDASLSARELDVQDTAKAGSPPRDDSDERWVGAQDKDLTKTATDLHVLRRDDINEGECSVPVTGLPQTSSEPATETMSSGEARDAPGQAAPVVDWEKGRADAQKLKADVFDAPDDRADPGVDASEAAADERKTMIPANSNVEAGQSEAETRPDIEQDKDEPDEAVEPIKPVLARIEGTDVLEADVEDNSEDEAANEEGIAVSVDASSSTGPLPKVNLTETSDVEDSVLIKEAPANEQPVDAPDEIAAIEANQQHALLDVQEDEGILSGDLADRDSSVERQPMHVKPRTVDAEPAEEEHEKGETVADRGLVRSEHAWSASTLVERNAFEEESSEDKQIIDDGDKVGTASAEEAKSEPLLAEKKAELPLVSDSQSESKTVDVPPATSPASLLPPRVPTSPASSDRRSTSSFTPSANRQGNRHLHGAAKRNLLAQMTAAASNLASNLAAPLRAIPSLLPINESQVDEAREDGQRISQPTTTAEEDVEDSTPAEDQQRQRRARKTADATEFTITTRSHCICRRLQLNKIEGAPVFIVPGCSINYEKARAEDAKDLGTTDEQNSNDWIDVDPDYLPSDVHHMLSRVIGLQMLNEGICVEPDSSAAKMLFAGYDLDADLLTSFDDEKEGISSAVEKSRDSRAEADHDEHASIETMRAEERQKSEEPIVDVKAEPRIDLEGNMPESEKADAIEDLHTEEPETPSRNAKQSPRHRRASSVASASSHHRSPRRPDPKSANADYLPDDELINMRKERHPPATAPCDVSIASLEEQTEGGVVDEANPDDSGLVVAIDFADAHNGEARSTGEVADPASAFATQPKKRRGRPRKRAVADVEHKTSLEEEEKSEDDKDEAPSEPEARKSRGRKRAASSKDVSTEDRVTFDDAKHAQDAAAVEDALEAAAPKAKRSRRGRYSQDAAAFEASEAPASEKVEEDENANPRVDRGRRDASTPDAKDEGKPKKSKKGAQRKRKQGVDNSSSPAESPAAAHAAHTEEAESARQPRRSRRSQSGPQAPGVSSSKTSPRKSPKRKVLKLN